jgi:excisionase family DNA binding protein
MTYSVKDLCERYAVGEHTVLAWIKSGDLLAVNVGRRIGGKVKWRITADALRAFEQLRAASQPTPAPVRRRRRSTETVKFYPE